MTVHVTFQSYSLRALSDSFDQLNDQASQTALLSLHFSPVSCPSSNLLELVTFKAPSGNLSHDQI